MDVDLNKVRYAKAVVAKALESCPQVTGIGITRHGDEYAVKVNLSEALPPETPAPHDIEGVHVEFEVVGQTRKL